MIPHFHKLFRLLHNQKSHKLLREILRMAVSTRLIALRDQLIPAEIGVHTVVLTHLRNAVTAGIMEFSCIRVADTTGGDTTGEYSYVCNTNTRKFHYPSCNSVSQMSENNRMYTNLSRDELIAQGYEPCGNCHP